MNKKVCASCNKNIDEDSLFCKYCGVNVTNKNVSIYNDEKLSDIFQRVYDTLCTHSDYTENEFKEKFEAFKRYENKAMSDNEYYQLLVDIIFYSGFRAATVEKYLERIHTHFPNYQIVSNYTLDEIEIVKNDSQMIRNRAKIDACVKNAKKVAEIVKKYGSVKDYIESFNPDLNDEALKQFKKNLEKNFSFIGGITSYHFMTDIGLNVLKPDRVILRIFKRLGLIEDDNDLLGAVKAGRAFSKATQMPIRFIDIIFVSYGQLNLDRIECICSEKNPKCEKCGVNADCLYRQSIVLTSKKSDSV